MKLRWRLAGGVTFLSLLLILVITSVELWAYWVPGFFESEYEKYGVLEDVRMEMDDLLEVTDEMLDYLRGDREDLHVPTVIAGQQREFFNEREIAHMEDVRDLFVGALWLRRAALVLIAAMLYWMWKERISFRSVLPKAFLIGTVTTVSVVAAIGVFCMIDFTTCFTIFHKIFFRNDLWLLDPRTDLLINIVPEGFFIDIALRIALTIGAGLLVLFLVSLLFLKKGKQVLAAALILSMALLSDLPALAAGKGEHVTAQEWPEGPEVASEGAILIDATTGTVLYEKNADSRFYPASITKILTALLAIENCALDDIVTYTANDIYSLEAGASTIALRPGEQLTVEESLYGLLLASGNDCANGLAHQAGGNIDSFMEMMNRRLEELGCVNSHFTNPHGLHNENHYTTPYDMALIMREAISNSTYLRLDSTVTHFIPETNLVNERRPVKMRHSMMDPYSSLYYEGIVAGKTGYTSSAGNTLVTYAVRGDVKLICVVMRSIGKQYTDTKKLLDYGFGNFSMMNISALETKYSADGGQIGGEGSIVFQDSLLSVRFDPDSKVILPKNAAFSELESSLEFHEEENRDSVGSVVYTYDGMPVGSAELWLEDEGKSTFPFPVRSGLFLIYPDGSQEWNLPYVLGLCVVLGVGGFFGWRALRSYRERKHTLHFKAKRKLKFK